MQSLVLVGCAAQSDEEDAVVHLDDLGAPIDPLLWNEISSSDSTLPVLARVVTAGGVVEFRNFAC